MIDELGLSIEKQIKWTPKALLDATKSLHEKYGRTPSQLVYQNRIGKLELPLDDLQQALGVVDAASRYRWDGRHIERPWNWLATGKSE